MRTTLSLEPDVAAQLETIQKKKDISFKQLVNDALRLGLARMSDETPRQPFRTQPADLGACRFASLDNVWEVLADAEGERESAR